MPDSSTGPLGTHLAGGRSAATFAVLAGVGLSLGVGRRDSGASWRRAAAATFVRAVLIGVVGLAVGVPDSGVAVILAYYAVLFVLAIPLLRLPFRALVPIALLLAVGAPVLSHSVRPRLADNRPGNPTFGDLADPGQLLQELTVTGYYPAMTWLTYLAAGLAVGRLALRRRRVQTALIAGGVVLAAAAKGASLLLLEVGGRDGIAGTLSPLMTPAEVDELIDADRFGTTPTDTAWWLATSAPHSGTPADLLHTTGVAIAVLGLLLLISTRAGRLLTPLASAGSMTLSLYSAHVLALGWGGLPDDDETSWAIQAVAALTIASLWRWRWRRGPLEAAVALAVRLVTRRGRVPAQPDEV